jgi:glycerol uptake facilitator-like aquaporin
VNRRAVFSELLGSVLLAATVIGSGIMAERMSAGNGAIALLANTLATCGALYALISVLSPVSGAHFNPLVSIAMLLERALDVTSCACYIAVQFVGMFLGMILAHAMFELPLVQASEHVRSGAGIWLSEVAASFVLLLVIMGCVRQQRSAAAVVAATIGAGYWFTASTSFANPAITVARSFTNSFAGIRQADVFTFIAAQALGAVLALGAARVLFPRRTARD